MMNMGSYFWLAVLILGVCGLVYLVLNKKENRSYEEWLDGYLNAERVLDSQPDKGSQMKLYWRCQNDVLVSKEVKRGWTDCYLDRGLIR